MELFFLQKNCDVSLIAWALKGHTFTAEDARFICKQYQRVRNMVCKSQKKCVIDKTAR